MPAASQKVAVTLRRPLHVPLAPSTLTEDAWLWAWTPSPSGSSSAEVPQQLFPSARTEPRDGFVVHDGLASPARR